MISSYSNFITESVSKNAAIFTFYNAKNSSKPYRMYYFENVEYGYEYTSTIKELGGLHLTQENFQYTSENILILLNDEDFNTTLTPYDKLQENENVAIKRFLEELNNMSYPSLYELHDGDYLEFGYYDAMIEHNDNYQILSSNTDHDKIQIHKNPEKYYPIALKALKANEMLNDIREVEFEFVYKAEGFEYSNMYKSLNIGNKYKLFDYASFNESFGATFKYVILFSAFEPINDYIILSNEKVEESHLLNEDDLASILIIELERPIKTGEDLYIGISYIDDNIDFKASLDPIEPTKYLIDTYDYILAAGLDDGPTGPLIKDIDGTVVKTSFDMPHDIRLGIKNVEDMFDENYEHKILCKYNGDIELTSYEDKIVLNAIDNDIDVKTILNIKWEDPKSIDTIINDPKFKDKKNLITSLIPINKFKL